MENKKDKNKWSELCKELLNDVEEAIQCPICFEMKVDVVHCTTGHHVCQSCRQQLTNCANCKSPFTQTKSFIIEDLSNMLTKVRLTFLAHDANVAVEHKEYRMVIKTLLNKLTVFLNKESDTLLYFHNFLKKSNIGDEHLQREFSSLTSNLETLQLFMKDVEKTVKDIKK